MTLNKCRIHKLFKWSNIGTNASKKTFRELRALQVDNIHNTLMIYTLYFQPLRNTVCYIYLIVFLQNSWQNR